MTSSSLVLGRRRVSRSVSLCFSSAIVLATLCVNPPPARAQEQKGAGVTLGGDVDAKDLGLPLYPGSRRHTDKDLDSRGANFGLWGGGSGFKLAVLKLESDDPPDKVAEYYKKALAKYGKVLDCSRPSPAGTAKEESPKEGSPKPITCDSDKPEPGGMLFKAGTKEKQHAVGIQPNGRGSLFQLVYVASWSNDERK